MSIAGIIEYGLRKQYKLSESFYFYMWESVTNGYIVGGATCEIHRRGKLAGKPDYATAIHYREFIVSNFDMEKMRIAYQTDTGQCSDCMGERRKVASCGKSGTTYKVCETCNGTGRAE